jgi:hypothetical protein
MIGQIEEGKKLNPTFKISREGEKFRVACYGVDDSGVEQLVKEAVFTAHQEADANDFVEDCLKELLVPENVIILFQRSIRIRIIDLVAGKDADENGGVIFLSYSESNPGMCTSVSGLAAEISERKFRFEVWWFGCKYYS